MWKEAAMSQRLLRCVGVATFFVCLGWTIPYMVIVPFLRMGEAFSMVSTGTPVLLGPDLTTLIPCALCMYYVFFGKSVRQFWSRVPCFGPFILMAFAASLGTTLTAHLAYVTAADKFERPGVFLAALAGFLTWRIAVSALAYLRPLDRFVAGAQ
jgi:hypothetical protein